MLDASLTIRHAFHRVLLNHPDCCPRFTLHRLLSWVVGFPAFVQSLSPLARLLLPVNILLPPRTSQASTLLLVLPILKLRARCPCKRESLRQHHVPHLHNRRCLLLHCRRLLLPHLLLSPCARWCMPRLRRPFPLTRRRHPKPLRITSHHMLPVLQYPSQ